MDVVVREVVGPDGGGRRRRPAGRSPRAPRGGSGPRASRSSPMPPLRQIWTPFIDTSSWPGRSAAVVVPTAESTRPQLGSLPKMAVLKRLERATRAADLDGVVLAGRADDLDGDVVAGALGVGDQLPGQVGADRGHRVGRTRPASTASRPTRRRPAAPRCRWWTCSRRSRPGRSVAVASRRAASSVAGVDDGVRGEDHEHGGQAGASMPAPLAMPPTDQPSPPARGCLGTVSVVMIALGGGRRRRRRERGGGRVDAGADLVHGQLLADQPGRADHDVAGARCRGPRRPARRCGGCPGSPAAPVQALAPPELSTTASARPSVTTCRDHCTGAPRRGCCVKTAAAWWSGPSLTTRATSGLPVALRPAVTPAARKPSRGGDAHGATPATGRPAVSGRPRARFMDWMAPPAVPLVRLSMAATTTTRPSARRRHLHCDGVASPGRPRCAATGPRAAGGRTARRRRPRSRRPAPARRRRPAASRAVAVARMPARHRRQRRGEGDA